MVSIEENELLTRVGPGTPMGELFRRYWIPAVLSEEIPEPDCPPVRTKLLCEDLVAFRDSQGRPGLLAENCSHRRASLFYGRNEECGLRCIYHGWKYDIDGTVLETPAEPAESMIRHHVKHTAYPCREVNGIIWTYMGPTELVPPLPDYPWITLPRDRVDVGSKFFLECNWLQCLEGDNDSIHSAYLHFRQRPARDGQQRAGRESADAGNWRRNPATVDFDINRWGVRAWTRYPIDDDRVFVRTNTFVMPCVGNTPRGRSDVNEAIHTIYQVPADDYSNLRYDFEVYWDQTTDGSYSRQQRKEVTMPGFKKIMNLQNNYLIDRGRQKSGELYCGIDAGNHTQDACVTETMGPITDRTQEHLGVSDGHLIELRKYLLSALSLMQEGKDPPGIFRNPEENKIGNFLHMVTASVPRGKEYRDLLLTV
ncbi:MAG: Rieske 2Fe-2S domain-containing protein [Chloroflexi bacterium]|nr:Rieske 2Fe-2S domain-containing protein [Chloroflexota bacterium]